MLLKLSASFSPAPSMSRYLVRRLALSVSFFAVGLSAASCTYERDQWDYRPPAISSEAPDLSSLEDLHSVPATKKMSKEASEQNVKMKEAGFSLGARYGLVKRCTEINAMLDKQADTLDRLWKFRALTIALPSGDGVIIPPVVETSTKNVKVSPDGQSLSAATKILRIIAPARIADQPPDWRNYLQRHWPKPAPPSGLLLPRDDNERVQWKESVDQGWVEGQWQADEAFRTSINRLRRDFIGQVRYLSLVKSGEMKELYLAKVDLGVTGGGDEMKIGERLVRIVEPARLSDGAWAPVVLHPVEPGAPISGELDVSQ